MHLLAYRQRSLGVAEAAPACRSTASYPKDPLTINHAIGKHPIRTNLHAQMR